MIGLDKQAYAIWLARQKGMQACLGRHFKCRPTGLLHEAELWQKMASQIIAGILH
jgi:hypothetical protein